jgi:hypothetical protein
MESSILPLLLFLTQLSSSPLSAAQNFPFSYRTLVTAETGVTCQQSADALSNRFEAATGISVTDATCTPSKTIQDQGKSYQVNAIVLNYLAAQELQPYQVTFSGRIFNDQALGDAGIFNRYSDCLQALADQKTLFEKNTHLTAVSGHCDVSTDSVLPGFYFTLESFGQPQMQLFAYAADQGSLSFYQDPLIQTAAASTLVAAGAVIAWSDATRIYYYSEQDIFVMATNLGLFDSEDICAQQIQDAKNIFTNGGLSPNSVFCAKYYSSDLPQRQLTLVGAGQGHWNQDFATHSAKYSSLNECLQDKARVIKNHLSSGQRVLGAICKPEETSVGQFVIEVYTNSAP